MDSKVGLTTKMESIRNQSCFKEFKPEEVAQLAELLSEVYFKPGETIVREGDPVDSVFLIIHGTAQVKQMVVVNQAIQENLIATLSDGQAIGLNETGFYSISGKRTATVVALTDMILLRLNLASFHGFALANSHVNEVMRKNAETMLGSVKE